MMYEMIRKQLERVVPFASHIGVELVELSATSGVAALPQAAHTLNHVQTQHAGAIFSVAEAASGAAGAGLLAEVIMGVKPVVREARITYLKPATGKLTARGASSSVAADVVRTIKDQGKADFVVEVDVTNEEGILVAKGVFDWHARLAS